MTENKTNYWPILITFNVIVAILCLSGVAYLLMQSKTPTENVVSQIVVTPTSVVKPTLLIPPMDYTPKVDYKFTLANLPKIDGSTSNVPLRSFMICKLLGYKCAWEDVGEPDTTIKERVVTIDTTDANKLELGKKSVNSTTHNAYVKLINGETDIIFVATLPSLEEQDLLKQKNVELDIKPIAMDAFVFIENKSNQINNLTLGQLLDVYTGKTTNWKELGGKSNNINAYQREDNSGSQELMRTLVLKGTNAINAPAMIVPGMIGLINRVAEDVNALGYSVYYYEQFMVRNTDLKLLSVNGVYPSYNSLSDESYPLSSPVYVVTKKGLDTKSAAYNLSQWLFTKEGQDVVKNSGYVPAIK